jgi:hypothetical protein
MNEGTRAEGSVLIVCCCSRKSAAHEDKANQSKRYRRYKRSYPHTYVYIA